jgi:hypothetical protein
LFSPVRTFLWHRRQHSRAHGSDGGIQWISYLHAKLGRAADSLDLVVKGHRPPLALRLTYVLVYSAVPILRLVQHRRLGTAAVLG